MNWLMVGTMLILLRLSYRPYNERRMAVLGVLRVAHFLLEAQ